jgi:hypothetical protein
MATDSPRLFQEALDIVPDHMRETMIAKQHDYGPGNISDFGDYGVLVRVNDKVHRAKNLYLTGDAPRNETVDDTWLDIACYALIAMMWRRGIWGFPMTEATRD